MASATAAATVVEEDEYRAAETITDAFLDCARYNDGDDAKQLFAYLATTPSLIDARDEQGRTAVHLAAANGHIGILEMLMEFGPSPDVPNHEGNTALHFAALNNQLEAARRLLKWGWHASTRNLFDKTPIQLIYGKNFEAMETLLLEHDHEIECHTRGTVSLGEDENNFPPRAVTVCVGDTLLQSIPAPRDHGEQLTSEESSFPADINNSPPTRHHDPARLLGSADVDGVE
ncbi:e3 ubiquitin-protein ligase MIB2 [Trypanosoma rangeli]|uniref:E3 ubiquitin-protein ligase MIB2 n=1 Tax=Trypanosoma rangeli TaxID=5698 RepID=A0A3R7KXF5_TRYRA|nr:e3 ubiquitin-protein ligase MIB2 [Trypanosoma rangeli]RNF11632.1 e3 ubiquitin-protein ligase MIB2 [Trypanosoma rangeli]|eukprot:RNF11632.1 e3 ubiquitin-protein ligase MIB2 [Trypanosoma rangeli]